MARQRIYYTKDQIKDGLITEGNEWMLIDGTEYIGQYHKYSTGEVYTGATYIDGKSKRLIPYKNIKLDADALGISIKKNFIYDDIKTVSLKKTLVPNDVTNIPDDDDYIAGYYIRYFASKVNEDRIIELSEKDFNKIGNNGGLDENIWIGFTMRWKISGLLNDELRPNGSVKEAGVIDTNKRTVTLLAETYPTLKSFIKDYQKFYRP